MPVILPVSLLTVRRLAEPGVIVITACQSLPKYSFGARMSKASATVGAGSRGPGGGRPRRAAARASVPSSSSEVMDRMPTLAQLRGSLRAPMAAAFANGAGGFSFILSALVEARDLAAGGRARHAPPVAKLISRSALHLITPQSSANHVGQADDPEGAEVRALAARRDGMLLWPFLFTSPLPPRSREALTTRAKLTRRPECAISGTHTLAQSPSACCSLLASAAL